jgi:hypothetical protein
VFTDGTTWKKVTTEDDFEKLKRISENDKFHWTGLDLGWDEFLGNFTVKEYIAVMNDDEEEYLKRYMDFKKAVSKTTYSFHTYSNVAYYIGEFIFFFITNEIKS